MPQVNAGESATFTFAQKVGEFGKHGAVILKRLTLRRQDANKTEIDLTPVANILREEAHAKASPNTAAVGAAPVYGAGGGTGGKNIYTITVDDSTGFVAGEYVRSQAAGRKGVYEIDTVPDGTHITVFAKNGELDIQNGDTIEEVDPEGRYVIDVDFASSQLGGVPCTVKAEVDGLAGADRGDDPALAAAVNAFKVEHYWMGPTLGQVETY